MRAESWRHATLPITVDLSEAIRNLNQVGLKIVLVINETGEPIGTVLDGDIRRGLLDGLDLKSPILSIVHRNPLEVSSVGGEMVMRLMIANKIAGVYRGFRTRLQLRTLLKYAFRLKSPLRDNIHPIVYNGARH